MDVYDEYPFFSSFPWGNLIPCGVLSSDVGEVIKESLLMKGDPRVCGK